MLHKSISEFVEDEDASVAVEYLLLAGILGLGWIAVGTEYRDNLLELYSDLSKQLRAVKFR